MIKLTEREKLLLKIAGGIFAVFIVYAFIITPLIYMKDKTGNIYSTNSDRLKRLDNIHEEYANVLERNKRIEVMLKDTQSPSAMIENVASEFNIQNNKVYNRDSQAKIQNKYTKITSDVKFEGVDIRSVLMFVNRIENTDRITHISYLRIAQAFKERRNYDVTLKIDTYRLD